jgi:GDP-L-fucose synthase
MYPDVNYPVKEEEAFSGEPFKGYEGVGWVKRFCEKAFTYYHNVTSTKFAFVRTTAVYGPHDNFDSDKLHVIPATIKKGISKEDPFIVWGDGTAVRDFVYVDDFIDGIFEVIRKEIWNDPINIATGTETTIQQMVETVIDLCNYYPKIIYDSSKPTAIPYRMLNVEKAKRMLGWTPKTNLVNGLYKTINWYKNEKHI